MPPMKYTNKAAYVTALRNLHAQAKRSGWNLQTASVKHLASWLGISAHALADRNRENGVSLDDIRAGRV